MKYLLYIGLLLTSWTPAFGQRVVRYDLYVSDTTLNYTGINKPGIAINGQVPAPTLYFTEGDTAEIHVHNAMHHETSIHWHGLILPNEQDGVPYLTTAPVLPHNDHIYRFPIKQHGTYWYHSHTMLQEQSGMYGALIIHPRSATNVYPEEVLLLSDWSNEKPGQIERSLHNATDWYAIKKGATQDYLAAIKAGKFKTKLTNEWKRMHAMDVSDVYYDRFLVQGKEREFRTGYSAGDTVRLRLINGSSSTYFWVNYGGGPITVVASDGAEVQPVTVDRLIIGVSETYDVLVAIPETNKMYEVQATTEDRTGKVSYWLGSGQQVPAPLLPRLNYFEGMDMMNDMMKLSGRMDDMGMSMSLQQMDMNAVMYPEISGTPPTRKNKGDGETLPDGVAPVTLNYSMLKAPNVTTLPDAPFTTYHFELTGNMNRYVWTVNNKTISESDKILIRKGENIRIILKNNSMMRHPMHLHGHFFRVLNSQGENAPLKTVLDIMPMETDTIEFYASEDYGDWYFHCHILYHMMSGMGRIFTYENTPPNPQLADPKQALKKVYRDDKRYYIGLENSIESNSIDGEFQASNTRWFFQAEWRIGYSRKSGFETESHVGRYLDKNQFVKLYTGWDFRYRDGEHPEKSLFQQSSTQDKRVVACIGLQYTLPLLIVADLRVDHTGYVRLQFSREDIPLTARLRMGWMFNSDLEYRVSASYILTKYVSASTHYDSDMGFGIGLKFTY